MLTIALCVYLILPVALPYATPGEEYWESHMSLLEFPTTCSVPSITVEQKDQHSLVLENYTMVYRIRENNSGNEEEILAEERSSMALGMRKLVLKVRTEELEFVFREDHPRITVWAKNEELCLSSSCKIKIETLTERLARGNFHDSFSAFLYVWHIFLSEHQKMFYNGTEHEFHTFLLCFKFKNSQHETLLKVKALRAICSNCDFLVPSRIEIFNATSIPNGPTFSITIDIIDYKATNHTLEDLHISEEKYCHHIGPAICIPEEYQFEFKLPDTYRYRAIEWKNEEQKGGRPLFTMRNVVYYPEYQIQAIQILDNSDSNWKTIIKDFKLKMEVSLDGNKCSIVPLESAYHEGSMKITKSNLTFPTKEEVFISSYLSPKDENKYRNYGRYVLDNTRVDIITETNVHDRRNSKFYIAENDISQYSVPRVILQKSLDSKMYEKYIRIIKLEPDLIRTEGMLDVTACSKLKARDFCLVWTANGSLPLESKDHFIFEFRKLLCRLLQISTIRIGQLNYVQDKSNKLNIGFRVVELEQEYSKNEKDFDSINIYFKTHYLHIKLSYKSETYMFLSEPTLPERFRK